MLMSMTGFGRAIADSPNKKVYVEIKSLNSKQLDLNVRIPACFRERELDVRAAIGHVLERGKVDVVITSETAPGAAVPLAASINIEAIRRYKEQIVAVAHELGIPEPADWYSVLMRFPGKPQKCTWHTGGQKAKSSNGSLQNESTPSLRS